MEVLEDLVKPAHFFRALVANGFSSRSSHVMGRSSTNKDHVSLGQTHCLKRRSFCWRVSGASSINPNIRCNFLEGRF